MSLNRFTWCKITRALKLFGAELALSEQSKMKVCPLFLLAGITKKSAKDTKIGLIWRSDCAGKPPSKQQFFIIDMFRITN
jgi:hypothetical protein